MAKAKLQKPKRQKKQIRNTHALDIEERLIRCSQKDSESIVYVGDVVERALRGEIGAVIKALTAGRISAEIQSNKDGKLSSERVLGRLEMADALWDDLEQFVHDKDALVRPLDTKQPEPSYTIAEPRQSENSTFYHHPQD